jgi:2-oxoglutarate dehydrogenase E2 component (dihydrolipoamide succinyltransferase)
MDILAPTLPESVSSATIVAWLVADGSVVAAQTVLLQLETAKVVLEVVAPSAGQVKILKPVGATVHSQETLGALLPAASNATAAPAATATERAAVHPAATAPSASIPKPLPSNNPSPTARRREHQQTTAAAPTVDSTNSTANTAPLLAGPKQLVTPPVSNASAPGYTRVPLSPIRARIAAHLLHASQSTASLTTFNEVNLQAINQIRSQHKEAFLAKHGIKLGLMSFFVTATCLALKKFPIIAGRIEQNSVLLPQQYDIGVAIASSSGLVVPVLRNVASLSLAAIEQQISNFSSQAKTGKLTLTDMTGGHFTITNGGVFGSLFSTPIINVPQSAILGMHTIQERPVAEAGNLVIRPMMYLALSYDHRLIDGADAVSFLRTIKETLEDPAHFFLEL